PWRESIGLLEAATPEQDMAPEGSRLFGELLRGQRGLLLILHEYWSQAMRDPKLRAAYTRRRTELRTALGKAIAARLEHLGAPPLEGGADAMATAVIGLVAGLAQEKLIDPDAVPDDLLGDTLALIYAGHLARGGARRAKPDDGA